MDTALHFNQICKCLRVNATFFWQNRDTRIAHWTQITPRKDYTRDSTITIKHTLLLWSKACTSSRKTRNVTLPPSVATSVPSLVSSRRPLGAWLGHLSRRGLNLHSVPAVQLLDRALRYLWYTERGADSRDTEAPQICRNKYTNSHSLNMEIHASRTCMHTSTHMLYAQTCMLAEQIKYWIINVPAHFLSLTFFYPFLKGMNLSYYIFLTNSFQNVEFQAGLGFTVWKHSSTTRLPSTQIDLAYPVVLRKLSPVMQSLEAVNGTNQNAGLQLPSLCLSKP